MASKPHAPKTLEDKRSISKGFDLASITDGIAGLFNSYSTVQVKNGSQALLLQRADPNDGSAGAPVVALSQAQGGTLSISSTSKANNDATRALALKKAKGFWGGLPTPAKIGIVAGGGGLLLAGGIYLYLR